MAVTDGVRVPGIDVSHYQGTVNWAKVKAAGIRFAYIKATQGADFRDPQLSANVAGATAQAIPFGLYHVFVANAGLLQISNWLKAKAAFPSQLPAWLDIEPGALTEETGTQINIDEDGTITIAATDPAKAEEAKRRIEQITAEVEIGKIYEGPITKILDFGALVNLLPGKDGLLHISQIAHERVEKVTDYLSEGQIVRVKVMETDEKGRIKLSMKVLLDRPNQGGQDNHG